MSWLYTLVFAGLLLSSDSDRPVHSYQNPEKKVSAHSVAGQDETEKFEQTYPLNANGRVSVSNVNGPIVVEAWDRNEVRLEAIKIADTKDALADVQIRVNSRPDFLAIEADYTDAHKGPGQDWKAHRKLEVHFRLSVPRTAALNEIETVNGSVTVGNFVNYTKISAVNGNVTATNLRGTASLSTVNGAVNADFDRLDGKSRITLDTVNGRVNLVIPSDSNATIRADSLNGNITNSFGLPIRKGEYVGRDLHGRVGTGEVQIKLSSVNGGLAINRKNDGRSPNPATNLLPQRREDDWDDGTEDEHEMSKAAAIDRQVALAVRQSQRQTVARSRVAPKPVGKVKPGVEKFKTDLEKIKAANAAKATGAVRIDGEGVAKLKLDGQKLQEAMEEGLAEQALLNTEARLLRDVRIPTIEQKRNTFAVAGTPRVTIDAKGSGVKVRGWDKQEVQYVVTEFAGRFNDSPLSVTETNTRTDVSLKVINSNRESRGGRSFIDPERVRIEVFVPRKSNLKVVTDGEIRVEGISGNVELKGADEAINVRDVDGKLCISAAEGQVRIIGFKGEFESQTVDGEMFLEGEFEKLTARATEGTIFLTLPSNANASIISNTDVETDGIEAARENQKAWRIGKGGAKYNFVFTEGRLVIRNSDLINSY